MVTPLHHALHSNSPRLSPVPTPWRSLLIHNSIVLLWLMLFYMAFVRNGVWAWSVGIAYIGYDTLLLAFVFWQTLDMRKKHTVLPATMPSTLGVIVAAHNEANVLPFTLEELLRQSDLPDQIIIADDGSTDHTAEILTQKYGLNVPELGSLSAPSSTYPNLYWLRLPHGGKACALNTAMAYVTTEIVLTVDGDTLLDRSAIYAVRQAFSVEPELVAATGILTPVCGHSLSGRFFQWFQTYEYIRNFISRYAWMRTNSLLLVSGAFASFRTSVIRTVGGFDPDCLVEDYELIHRIQRYGMNHNLTWRVRVLGNAHARTDAPGNIRAFMRQRRRWFEGFLQTHYWYRDMVGNEQYGMLGVLMLPVKAADTLQPVYGLTAFILLIQFLLKGQAVIVGPVLVLMGIKVVIDLAFHLWSIHLYRHWVSYKADISLIHALFESVAEPFTFQLLRHSSAVWGWFSLLSGRQAVWGEQSRVHHGFVLQSTVMMPDVQEGSLSSSPSADKVIVPEREGT